MSQGADYTPGPWAIRHGTNIFAVRTDVGHEGVVCNTGGHRGNHVDCGPECEANARLIAAAPDLLAACEAAMRVAVLWCPESCSDPLHMQELAVLGALKEKIKAAIEKATNSQPSLKLKGIDDELDHDHGD